MWRSLLCRPCEKGIPRLRCEGFHIRPSAAWRTSYSPRPNPCQPPRIDFSAEELIKIFDSMDIETFEDIFKQWNSMRFSYNTLGYCTCADCGYEDQFDFKDIDNFYPKSWFNIGGI